MLNMAPRLQRAEAHFGAILSPEWPSYLLPRNFLNSSSFSGRMVRRNTSPVREIWELNPSPRRDSLCSGPRVAVLATTDSESSACRAEGLNKTSSNCEPENCTRPWLLNTSIVTHRTKHAKQYVPLKFTCSRISHWAAHLRSTRDRRL